MAKAERQDWVIVEGFVTIGEYVAPIETITGKAVDSLPKHSISQRKEERRGFKTQEIQLQHENTLKATFFKTFLCKEVFEKTNPFAAVLLPQTGFV